MSDQVIKIKNYTFDYPDGTNALKKINLEIKRGEFVAVMGPNGAGKTTLCLSLNGAVPNITGGEMEGIVDVLGWDTIEHHTYEIASKVGMILQDPETQLFSTDVFSEIAFGLENLGYPKEDIIERIEWAMNATRIKGLEKRTPWTLSGGQKQRVAIAAIMAMRPEILVLDEPTSQLDPIGTHEVFSVVKDLNKKYNTTVVMAEHKTELIAQYADRVILMNKGQVIADGPTDEILSQRDLLDEIFVKVCEVSNLGCELQNIGLIDKVPITLPETEKILRDLIARNKVKAKPIPEKRAAIEKPDETPLLELRDLCHVYPPDIQALKNINLSIYRGEFVGFIGQNGAGKTTLIKHLIGLLKPTSGQVLLDGEDTVDFTVPQLSKRVGVVLQNPDHQIFSQSVAEEVAFAPTIAELPEEEIKRRSERAI
ncbi:MAG: ABC transporter ATP-binding protein, partial [Candidatus Ranarchaeia archaeon]